MEEGEAVGVGGREGSHEESHHEDKDGAETAIARLRWQVTWGMQLGSSGASVGGLE